MMKTVGSLNSIDVALCVVLDGDQYSQWVTNQDLGGSLHRMSTTEHMCECVTT